MEKSFRDRKTKKENKILSISKIKQRERESQLGCSLSFNSLIPGVCVCVFTTGGLSEWILRN